MTLVGTYKSLGITPGTYVYTVAGATDGTVTVEFNNNTPTDAPEPASGLILAAAFGLLGMARHAGRSAPNAS